MELIGTMRIGDKIDLRKSLVGYAMDDLYLGFDVFNGVKYDAAKEQYTMDSIGKAKVTVPISSTATFGERSLKYNGAFWSTGISMPVDDTISQVSNTFELIYKNEDTPVGVFSSGTFAQPISIINNFGVGLATDRVGLVGVYTRCGSRDLSIYSGIAVPDKKNVVGRFVSVVARCELGELLDAETYEYELFQTLFVNGKKFSTKTTTTTLPPTFKFVTSHGIRFGKGYQTPATPVVGMEFCAMRFHGAALTDEQIEDNYALDYERFKLWEDR